jgi:hypothetical protein
MTRKWFWFKGLMTLILIGLLAVGGYVVYRTAWSQGYVTGQLALEGEEDVTVPSPFAYPGWPYRFMPYHPFGGLALLFKVVLALIFFGLIGRLIGFIVWGTAFRHPMAGKWPTHWHPYYRRWHRFPGRPPHGPVPPWYWGWEEEPEEEEDTAAAAES